MLIAKRLMKVLSYNLFIQNVSLKIQIMLYWSRINNKKLFSPDSGFHLKDFPFFVGFTWNILPIFINLVVGFEG
jgi:hypothetical protein